MCFNNIFLYFIEVVKKLWYIKSVLCGGFMGMNEEVKEIFKTNKAYKLDDICKKIKTMSKEDIQK